MASWCMSEYNHSNRYEIEIMTVREQRRKGLSTASAEALMRRYLGHSLSYVGWYYWKRNTPSNKTTLKLGFRFVRSYLVYVLEMKG